MTQTKLKDGIVNKLRELKNKIARPEITIYDEQVRQGFKEPCFFVQFFYNKLVRRKLCHLFKYVC